MAEEKKKRSTKVDATKAVTEYIDKEDWRINANANTGYSHAGLVNNLAGKLIANYWLDEVYSKEEGDAHRNGDYHIHDLDNLAPYCFTSDTRLHTQEFGVISIADLLRSKVSEFHVTSYEKETQRVVIARASNLRLTRKLADLVEVEFEDGLRVRCTPDHQFRMCDGTWNDAKELGRGIRVVSVFNGSVGVKRVTPLAEKEDVYCMEVWPTRCFALENGAIAHNCCGHDFQKLLDEGFGGVTGRPNSKPPKHFREALYQLANYFGILQAEWAGAQAVSSFDTYLSPYVFLDMHVFNQTYDDIKKAVRNFIYNVNVPSRWGQSPFTNITIDWTVPNMMKDLPPMRGGKPFFASIYEEWGGRVMWDEDLEKDTHEILQTIMWEEINDRISDIDPEVYESVKDEKDFNSVALSFTYRFFQKEMNIINKAFYEILNEGDTLGQPFTFPIPTINITEEFDWNGENTDLLFENTAKYGSSYFQNFIGSQYMKDEHGNKVRDPNAYTPNDVRSMCCRLQLDKRELRRRGGGLFGSDAKTGCYDDQTEILTKKGWKFFKDISFSDEIYTLTENDRKIELHSPKNIFCYDYEGDLIHYTGRVDLMVTPNHNMPCVIHQTNKICWKKAEECTKYFNLPLSGDYVTEHTAPQYYTLKAADAVKHGKNYEDIKIDMKVWLAFLGLFLSEGSIRGSKVYRPSNISRYEVVIVQKKPENISIIDGIMEKMPFNVHRRMLKNGSIHWCIGSKTLWQELIVEGDSGKKFIPKYVFDLPKDYLQIIFDMLMMGDGCVRKTKQDTLRFSYSTNSLQLANDMQQLSILLGHAANIIIDDHAHRQCNRYGVNYVVSINLSFNRTINGNERKLVPYKGKVYCVEVPNHIVCVRRNRKVVWCGNSIGVVTLNCARIGYLYKNNLEGLYKRVDYLCDLAKSTLEKKRKVVTDLMARGLYPYTRRYVGSFNTFFSTIGVNGINEMIRNFTNDQHDITDDYGQKLACDFLDHVRDRLVTYQEETGNLYNLESSPAEGCISWLSTVYTDKGFKRIGELVGKTDIHVFTYNETTHEVELKPVESIYMTQAKAQVMKITFDNGMTLTCTLNHPIAKRINGFGKGTAIEWVEATNLQVGDHIKSIYLKEKDTGHVVFGGKHKVHRIVAKAKYGEIPEDYVVHHLNEDKWDNSLENIVIMPESEHKRLHLKLQQSRGLMMGGSIALYTHEQREQMKDAYMNGHLSFAQIGRLLGLGKFQVKGCIRTLQRNHVIEVNLPTCSHWQYEETPIEYLHQLGKNKEQIIDILGGSRKTKEKTSDYVNYLAEANHVVTKIEYLNEEIPVYNMTVKDNNNYYVSDKEDAKDCILIHNCMRRFAHSDKKKFPDILQAGFSNSLPYYTNSSQLPVEFTADPFTALDLQDDLQKKYTGGTVLHLYMRERVSSAEVCKKLVKAVLTNYRLPYISVTPTFSVCPIHGRIEGEHEFCPKCDAELIAKHANEIDEGI